MLQSFQDPTIASACLHEQAAGCGFTLFPDGSLALDFEQRDLIRQPVLLDPDQAIALYHFVKRDRVERRLLDIMRQRLRRSKAGKAFVRAVDKLFQDDAEEDFIAAATQG